MGARGKEELPWYSRPPGPAWRCDPPPDSARAFHEALPDYRPTPLVDAPGLATELGVGRLLVKDESSRLGLPAFKVLGASWAVARVLARRSGLTGPLSLAALKDASAARPATLVAATDGNHGRAVARMAALLGLGAHIFVPAAMTRTAARAIEGEGAAVTRVPGGYDDAVARAAAYTVERPEAELVQDVWLPGHEDVAAWVVEGYATLAHEVDQQLAEHAHGGPDLVVVPVGVGSLAQAIVAHYRSRPDFETAVLAVEPEAAACVLASLRAGELRSIPTSTTVMAGLNCETPSGAAWPYLRDGLDAAVAVTDGAALRAVDDLARAGVPSGPSGAAALAGARAALTGPGCERRRRELGVGGDSTVVLLSTEGRLKEDP